MTLGELKFCKLNTLFLLAWLQLIKARPQKYVWLHLLWVETFMSLKSNKQFKIIQENEIYAHQQFHLLSPGMPETEIIKKQLNR